LSENLKSLHSFFVLITIAFLSFSASAVPEDSNTQVVDCNYNATYQLEDSFVGPIYIDHSIEKATYNIGNKTYEFADGFIAPIDDAMASCRGCAIAYASCLFFAIDGSACYTVYQSCAAIFC
jgi:hypothetical protein